MSRASVHVCVVCSGNICRSPMAEMVLREHLRRAGLAERVRLSSAGMGPWHVGDPADPRAVHTLATHGYDTEHTAQQVDAHQLDADLLLAADSGHLRALRAKLGDDERVRLLREFDPSAADGAEIPDPYYGDGFEEVLGMIERAAPGIVDWIRERV